MALAARDSTGLPALTTVGWFSLLPKLRYVAGSVVPPTCHLALAAAQASPGAMHGDAQHDSKLATTRDELGGVGQASPWTTCDAPKLPLHGGQSDSPAR